MSSHFCSDRSWCFFRRPVDISSCFAILRETCRYLWRDIIHEEVGPSRSMILATKQVCQAKLWRFSKPNQVLFCPQTNVKLQHKETFSAETYSANSKAVTWATGLVSNHNNSVATQHEHTCGFNTSVICRNIHCQHVFWRLGWRLRGNLQFLWWLL